MSGKTKHTPDWIVSRSRPPYHEDNYEIDNPYKHLDSDSEDFDAQVEEVREANWNLIFAAPDLLAACELVMEWHLAYEEGELEERMLEKLGAAIAKAKGVNGQ